MRKPPVEKTTVTLDFDKDVLKELKRYLFSYGLTLHQFFGYLAEAAGFNDKRLIELTREARNYKAQRILDGKIKKIEPETLYSMIERELEKQQKNKSNNDE